MQTQAGGYPEAGRSREGPAASSTPAMLIWEPQQVVRTIYYFPSLPSVSILWYNLAVALSQPWSLGGQDYVREPSFELGKLLNKVCHTFTTQLGRALGHFIFSLLGLRGSYLLMFFNSQAYPAGFPGPAISQRMMSSPNANPRP